MIVMLGMNIYLYRYKRIFGNKDYIFIPNIYKSSITLSSSLKKFIPFCHSLESFVEYFFPNDLTTLYKNLEKMNFCFYSEYKDTIIKVEGKRIGKKSCVIEISNIEHMKETHEFWSKKCQSLENKVLYLEQVLDCVPMIICGRNQDGTINYCNRAYSQIAGKSKDAIIKEQLSLMTQNKYEYLHTCGQRHFFQIQHFTMREYHITVGLDKTEYDNLKREFTDYLEATHNIFHQISVPISVFNKEHSLSFFNKAYQLLFDFDLRFLERHPSLSEILDDLRQRQKIPEPSDFMKYKNMHKSFFTNLSEPLEETLHLATGKILRSVISPQPSGGLLYIYEDITHSMQLEQENKRHTAAQKEILNHLHEGISVFGSDYRLRFANPMFQQMFQIEFLNGHMDDILQHVETPILSRQMILEMFEKRTYMTGYLNASISWAYTPLPDGGHLLSFFYSSQKIA